MTPELLQLLKAATEEQLKMLVASLYGIDDVVDQRIESVLLTSNSPALARQLNERINTIARSTGCIDYKHVAKFNQTFDILLDDIAQTIDVAPKHAFELVDRFMSIHESIYEQVDDSDGDIGAIYAQALEVWLKAARHNDNGYAVWDDLIAGSGELLTKDELMQLSKRFEKAFKQARKAPANRGYNAEAATAALGIAEVAKALSDVKMFERSILIDSPKPNEVQIQNIVRFCLSVNDGESALQWLQGTWDKRFESEKLSLLDAAYVVLGRHQELLELRRSAYQQCPDH
jgi:tetratricopeptide (TPR) repeat protein